MDRDKARLFNVNITARLSTEEIKLIQSSETPYFEQLSIKLLVVVRGHKSPQPPF